MSQTDDFCTLVKATRLTQLSDGQEAPAGCSVKVVSDQLTLMLEVDTSSATDTQAEILRLTKDVDRYAVERDRA